MKLYTEYQVREMLKKAFWQDFYEDITEESLISELTPIELPSDEEIRNEAWEYQVLSGEGDSKFIHFSNGAIWMRDKIQGGNNE